MIGRLALVGGAGTAVALGLAACSSTQATNDRIAAKAATSITQQAGLSVAKESRDVRVLDRTVLTDPNGTAITVRLKNTTDRPLVNVPIAVDVQDAKGASVYRNDTPGLEPSLTHVAAIPAGATVDWVNDQITAPGKTVEVRVGEGPADGPKTIPDTTVADVRLVDDPDGLAATGKVVNGSDVFQREIVLYAVALKGDRVIAAGRAQVPKLKAGRRAPFSLFFIGNPKGARVSVFAPPTTLR